MSGIQFTAAVLGGTAVVDGVARSRHDGEVRSVSANSESGRKQKKKVKRRRKPKSPAFAKLLDNTTTIVARDIENVHNRENNDQSLLVLSFV